MAQQQVPDGYQETTTLFEPEGVRIRIRTKKKSVSVVNRGLDIKLPPFKEWGRPVITYEITCDKLDLPYELEVRYTEADLEKVEHDLRKLNLCYVKGKKWVNFSKGAPNYFRLIPDPMRLEGELVETGGVGRVYIQLGSDPTVGWKS